MPKTTLWVNDEALDTDWNIECLSFAEILAIEDTYGKPWPEFFTAFISGGDMRAASIFLWVVLQHFKPEDGWTLDRVQREFSYRAMRFEDVLQPGEEPEEEPPSPTSGEPSPDRLAEIEHVPEPRAETGNGNISPISPSYSTSAPGSGSA